MPKCRSCKAEIEFIEGPSGRPIPAQKVTAIYVEEEDGQGKRKLVRASVPDAGPIFWVSHFQTCPEAERFSRGRSRSS